MTSQRVGPILLIQLMFLTMADIVNASDDDVPHALNFIRKQVLDHRTSIFTRVRGTSPPTVKCSNGSMMKVALYSAAVFPSCWFQLKELEGTKEGHGLLLMTFSQPQAQS